MDPEYEQIPIAGPPSPQRSFVSLQTQTQSSSVKLKGRLILQTFSYDPYLIDIQNRSNWLNRFFTTTFGLNTNANERKVFQRSFILYLPPSLKQDMKIVMLLHGTNQTIFDTELVCQITDIEGVKVRRYGWMQLADRQNFVVVVPQSRGIIYRERKYYGWQPGNEDMNYLFKIVQKITSERYHSEINLPPFSISPQNISIIGFSNGGLFTSDLYINYISSVQNNQKFSILIFINYMGGIQHELNSLESIKFDEGMKHTPMVIMSCKKEQNYGPCLRAHQFFQHHGCNVCFVEVDHFKHQFTLEAVDTAYQFIIGAIIKQNQ